MKKHAHKLSRKPLKPESAEMRVSNSYKKRIAKVKKHLRHGDQVAVADALNYTVDYVNKVVALQRQSELILQALEEIIEQRRQTVIKLKAISVKTLRVA
ncbi:hypothetical protein [Nodularia spumigena]|jgi:hypothetical protein|uniref:hypothetical protein n=1 Tax=Nodularia spumigena TaxID=70799 RepID=UPI00232A9F9D|nr:hypothetical protein [Nodularia spumigena]MDB9500037.1 hypothetical protein [Nodularia spumigena CS-336/02]